MKDGSYNYVAFGRIVDDRDKKKKDRVIAEAFPISGQITVQSASLRITAAPDKPPNAAGWNNSNVIVSFTCSGGTSPITCPAPVTVSTEGANQQVTGTARDAAGNTATATLVINLDKTPPVITPSQAPPPNLRGWNNSDVTVSFLATDTLSGIANATSPVIVRTEGANQVLTGIAADVAGNTSAATAIVNLDKTPPVTQNSVSPLPNANGWNDTNVTITFAGTDTLSGIASCSPAVTLSNEGRDQSASGTCTDIVGNVSVPTAVNNISIDKTPPVLSVSPPTPAPNAAGWNNTNVTIAFSVTDALSGVLNPPPSPLVIDREGRGVTGNLTVADAAGNVVTFTSPPVHIDKTRPEITVTRSPAPIRGWNNTPVTFTFSATDVLSGVAPGSVTPPITLSRDGPDESITGQATDLAGKVEDFQPAAEPHLDDLDSTDGVLNSQNPVRHTSLLPAE